MKIFCILVLLIVATSAAEGCRPLENFSREAYDGTWYVYALRDRRFYLFRAKPALPTCMKFDYCEDCSTFIFEYMQNNETVNTTTTYQPKEAKSSFDIRTTAEYRPYFGMWDQKFVAGNNDSLAIVQDCAPNIFGGGHEWILTREREPANTDALDALVYFRGLSKIDQTNCASETEITLPVCSEELIDESGNLTITNAVAGEIVVFNRPSSFTSMYMCERTDLNSEPKFLELLPTSMRPYEQFIATSTAPYLYSFSVAFPNSVPSLVKLCADEQKNYCPGKMWVGLVRNETTGEWIWSTGMIQTNQIGKDGWAAGEPKSEFGHAILSVDDNGLVSVNGSDEYHGLYYKFFK